ncbi:hypothetical protein [Streptococcus suis]|uniref:hypothetical protein n=2 Tax=Streptococcus suis TaxID=1307 RepID=UPI001EFF51A9|nr:hypothetical protein [Streptococcus suis]MCG9864954.1 hypothetical protein [Streptococcus suis]MCG9889423.1 hypothetical protein [Streptococcus suis]MCH1696331.1 hypothetical protein [Streptococcus suis]
MKRMLKKCQLLFCVLLLVFSSYYNTQKVKADVMTLGGGAIALAGTGAAAASALPILVIGLAAVLILGLTVTNWDDIAAFGNQVALELEATGYAYTDFVSGTAIRIDNNFKKAALEVYGRTGPTISKYYKSVDYSGGTVVNIGCLDTPDRLDAIDYLEYMDHDFPYSENVVNGIYDSSNIFLSNAEQSKWNALNSDYTGVNQYVLSSITVITSFEPTTAKVAYFDLINIGTQKEIRDNSGNLTGLILTLTASEVEDFVGSKDHVTKFATAIASDAPVTITDVSIPELNIGKVREEISTGNMMQTAISTPQIEQYINTAFPATSTTVTFDNLADVTGATLTNIGAISDYTLTDQQVNDLAKVRDGTITSTGAIAGATAPAGLDWLSKLWEWLKKLLDAILGLPAAILAGLQALWDSLIKWLTDIWTAITAIPGAISKAWTDALTWAFGVDQAWLDARIKNLRLAFNSKFPNIQAFNYHFGDKAAFDDIRITLPGFGTHAVVSGSAMTAFAVKAKPFISGLFYLLTALFFMRKFYKVSED